VPARRSFFQTEFGTLAFLPKATTKEGAQQTGTFRILQKDGSDTVKATHSPLWFQFNHHLADSNGEPRHLGALIIVLTPSVGSQRLAVYRNPGWTRLHKNEILGELSRSPKLSWDQFTELIRESSFEDASPEKTDKAFGGLWHAIPQGSDKDSWSYRKFWAWAVSQYQRTSSTMLRGQVEAGQFRVSARLIRYIPTPVPASKVPPVFDVHASPGDSIFLALYSLYNDGDDTQSWYWIHLE
jgi:hypothetical protein